MLDADLEQPYRTRRPAVRQVVDAPGSRRSMSSGPAVLKTARTREDAASLVGGTEAVEQLRGALAAYEAAGATGIAAAGCGSPVDLVIILTNE